MIQFKNVSKIYRPNFWNKKVIALKELTLNVEKGEVFGFLGPNGAGKSTTIKLLMDFIRPSSGKILIDGIESKEPKARRQLGYLPENPYFYDQLTPKDLLTFGARASGLSRQERKKQINYLLKKLELEHVSKRSLRQFSKGMLQRVGLALSLVHNPTIIILDEPMSGLDPLGRTLVSKIILELKEQGKTVFFSSHILSDVERLCDRIAIIHKGRLRFLDSIKNIVSKYKEQKDVETINKAISQTETKDKGDYQRILSPVEKLFIEIVNKK